MGPEESAVKLEATRATRQALGHDIGAPGLALAPDESAIKLQSVEIDPPSSTVIGRPGQPMGPGESEVKLSAFEDSDFDVETIKTTPRASTTASPTGGQRLERAPRGAPRCRAGDRVGHYARRRVVGRRFRAQRPGKRHHDQPGR